MSTRAVFLIFALVLAGCGGGASVETAGAAGAGGLQAPDVNLLPHHDDAAGVVIEAATFECSPWLGDTIMLTPIVTTSTSDGQRLPDFVVQNVNFFGNDGQAGITFSAAAELKVKSNWFGDNLRFERFGTNNHPIDNLGTWEQICESASWPMTVDAYDASSGGGDWKLRSTKVQARVVHTDGSTVTATEGETAPAQSEATAVPEPAAVSPTTESAWQGAGWFDEPPLPVPLRVEGFGLEVVAMTLDCEGNNLAPVLEVALADPTVVVNNIDQRLSFYGANGPEGRLYESVDDIVGDLDPETFGEFGVEGNPIDHPEDYAAICSESFWPVTLDLIDGIGGSLYVTVVARVIDTSN